MTRGAGYLHSPPPVELPLSEVFGPTWQGEGPHTGRRVAFVRLGLCNLACSWCDTPYTWDTTRYDVQAECPDTPIATIHDRLAATGCRTVVLSGGEPLMHHKKLPALLDASMWDWHVESNGTIPPPAWWEERVTHTTLSPKIATDDPQGKRLKPRALRAWSTYAQLHPGQVAWKFVVTNPTQLQTIALLQATYGLRDTDIWVMPEGTTPEAVLSHHRELADELLRTPWNTTTRLHTLLWGQERAR